MSSSFQETDVLLKKENIFEFNEEEREFEEALSLSDFPLTTITAGNQEDEAKLENNNPQNEDKNASSDFAFGLLVGSNTFSHGEMCAADEVFSGGQILPYRNSVSSTSGLRSFSSSESMDRGGFGYGSRSSSSRSSSIRSLYSVTSSSSGSSICSNNTVMSAKTIPIVSKGKIQNQFHSYPSPKPQILGSGSRNSTHVSSVGKKSKIWEVLKLGLVKTPEIELQDLKIRHQRTNNFGKSSTYAHNNYNDNNNGSSSSNNNNYDRGCKSCSKECNRSSNFVLKIPNTKSSQQRISMIPSKLDIGGGFFKGCKSSIGAIDPLPTRQNYNGNRPNKQGNYQYRSNSLRNQVSSEDKNLAQKKLLPQGEHQKRNSQIGQEKHFMSHHDYDHHHHRTFEWLKNLSHAKVLNS